MSLNQFFKGFKNGVKSFGDGINLIINTILLSIVYIIGIGTTKIFSRIANKSFLELKQSKECQSYWSDLNIKKKPIKEYYRQF